MIQSIQKIGIAGYGTVGKALHELIKSQASEIERRHSIKIVVKKIADPRFESKVIDPQDLLLCTKNRDELLKDSSLDLIVETIGDREGVKDFLINVLKAGKKLVTANKAVLARSALEILQASNHSQTPFYFEAAVGGSIPILRTLREAFAGDQILGIYGIVNGTSNFILSKMSSQKQSFAEVLAEAQKLGYAEADPTSDVEGIDAAYKLSLLILLAFGVIVDPTQIDREGITKLAPLDFEMASRFGYAIRSIAVAKKEGNKVSARVQPTLIPRTKLLALVEGAYNAIMVQGEHFGESVLYGAGAGGAATATAVLGDIIEAARATKNIPEPFAIKNSEIKSVVTTGFANLTTSYYVRFSVVDRPGALASIASLLSEEGISLAEVYQHGSQSGKEVPVIVLTHQTKEVHLQKALQKISAAQVLTTDPVLIRIESF